MLALTKKTEYALIALTRLAQAGEKCSSAREISDQFQLPLPLLMNVLKKLTQRGLVRSVRGARGGYALAVDADRLTLDEVIEAVEGPVALTQCIAERDGASRGACELVCTCRVREPVEKINDKLRSFLRHVTLADFTQDQEAGDEGTSLPLAAGA